MPVQVPVVQQPCQQARHVLSFKYLSAQNMDDSTPAHWSSANGWIDVTKESEFSALQTAVQSDSSQVRIMRAWRLQHKGQWLQYSTNLEQIVEQMQKTKPQDVGPEIKNAASCLPAVKPHHFRADRQDSLRHDAHERCAVNSYYSCHSPDQVCLKLMLTPPVRTNVCFHVQVSFARAAKRRSG